ncbi:hypothetical protein [Helicobacter rodentium]|nr:hypothetical protein [Helicobacter rodentium]
MTKQSIILHKAIFTMGYFDKHNIMDCHENFSNFLAMTKWKF